MDKKNKDWKGNSKSVFTPLGSSSHSEGERETHDYYATDPKAIRLLLEQEKFHEWIWEPACGEGHLSKEMIKQGYQVYSSDLIDRGYGHQLDFLFYNKTWHGDIITNPPFRYAIDFVKKGLQSISSGNKVAMFLRIQFLETKERGEFFKSFPPKTVYVSRSRIQCAMNGKFDDHKENGSAACYCWFIWEKGFNGTTELKWFN